MQEVFEKIIGKLVNKRKTVEQLIMENPQDELDKIQTQAAEDFASAYGEAIEIVKQEAEKYNNGWIPCSERLPEEGRGVILYAENKAFIGSHVVFMANIHNGKWQMWESSREVEINYIPIAWQPLSLLLEPYQPKGE